MRYRAEMIRTCQNGETDKRARRLLPPFDGEPRHSPINGSRARIYFLEILAVVSFDGRGLRVRPDFPVSPSLSLFPVCFSMYVY